MLRECGITEKQLPKLFESYECVGTLKKDVAALLGLSEDVVVAAGAGDNAAAAVGTGVVGNGGCNISLAPRAPSLSPPTVSGWTPTTPCIPLTTRTAATT